MRASEANRRLGEMFGRWGVEAVRNELRAERAESALEAAVWTPDELKVVAYALDASYRQSGAFVSDPAMNAAWHSVQAKIKDLQ